ncbi:hypothetical protein JCM19233_2946 [Vibrio astriarenae]|nr:hypothetical protein JCM19233_2946 [Vibrio sp. C7]
MWLLVVSATFGALLGEFSGIAMGGLFGSIVIALVVSQCLKLRGQASQTPSFLPSKMELPKVHHTYSADTWTECGFYR